MNNQMTWKKFYKLSKIAFKKTELKSLDVRNIFELSDFYYSICKEHSIKIEKDYIDGVCLCFGVFRSCKSAKPLLIAFYIHLCNCKEVGLRDFKLSTDSRKLSKNN